MSSTLDLGRRIELVSMDPHFHNITIGLYEQFDGGIPLYTVHSYSGLEGTRDRLDFIMRTMQALGGMQDSAGRLRFACAVRHQAAVRRVFLEACKLPPAAALVPRPLTVTDKKLDHPVSVTSLGPGFYEVACEGAPDSAASRLESISGGLRRLAEADFVTGAPFRLQFPCAAPHDALVGLLLPRALNVRAVLREEEMAASRGMLVAPSAQK